jgi:hypothetical protein
LPILVLRRAHYLCRLSARNYVIHMARKTDTFFVQRRNYEKCGLFLWEMCDGDAAKTTAQVETQSSAKRLAADQSATQKGIKPWAGNVSGSRDPGTQRNRTGDDRDGRNGTYRENIQETPLETQSRRHVRYLKRNLPSAFDALQTGHGKKPQCAYRAFPKSADSLFYLQRACDCSDRVR